MNDIETQVIADIRASRQRGVADYELIVRVLTERGPSDFCEDDIAPHYELIKNRYQELKKTHDFCTAAIKARAEWLREYMEGQSSKQSPASPWPMPIHNPDNLTPEQFGDPAVWRPATPDEDCGCEHELWMCSVNSWDKAAVCRDSVFKNHRLFTYRIRRDVRDWPKGGEK